jgi:crossover junction endodeoxyribonuclease RuvC
MIILGIDPGTATTGYGVISCDGKKICAVDWGWISTSKDDGKEKRLISTFQQTRAVIKKHKPDIVSIERLFFFINAKTAMSVAESGGVIRLAAALEKVPFNEYAPLAIKLEVTGTGKADKKMVKTAVRKLLNVRSPNKRRTHFDDVSDALAVAICHAQKCVMIGRQKAEDSGRKTGNRKKKAGKVKEVK